MSNSEIKQLQKLAGILKEESKKKKDTVMTTFELEKVWKDVYDEDFKNDYPDAYYYLKNNYKNFTIYDLVNVWYKVYEEQLIEEYPSVVNALNRLVYNGGKPSSKDKVVRNADDEAQYIEDTKEGKKLERIITKIMKSRIDPEIVDEYISTIYQGKIPKNKKIDALGGIMIKDLIDALLDRDFESDDIDDFIHEIMTNSQDY
jgi:hypothetical protein